eukprot:SAG11_NODE_35190_length_267_cov_76.363095_1_plen_72_part_00
MVFCVVLCGVSQKDPNPLYWTWVAWLCGGGQRGGCALRGGRLLLRRLAHTRPHMRLLSLLWIGWRPRRVAH